MYKVTIQSSPVSKVDWQVVTAGTWTPGQEPKLEENSVAAETLAELFNVMPSTSDPSGRNQIQAGDTLYAVVFRRLTR